MTFDVARDMGAIPNGCDLVLYCAVNGFDVTNEQTAGVAAVPGGAFRSEVERAGVWLACMEPVGGFDDAVYTGGSFVMDDGGRVVAQAPCFEEALLIQDVRRGMMVDALEMHEVPSFRRDRWLWEALRLHLRDAVEANGSRRVLVPLRGDLPSSLLAALAVDALDPATCSAFWWGMRMPSPPRTRLLRPNAPHARARSLRPFICAWSSGPRRARHFWPTATGPLASRHRCGPASTRCWWPIRPASSRRCPRPAHQNRLRPARQRDCRGAGGRFVALRRRVPVGFRVARQDARVRLGHDARALGGARRRQIGLRRGDTRRHRPTRRG